MHPSTSPVRRWRLPARVARAWSRWAASLLLLLLPALSHAIDTYDPATGTLTVPVVRVGNDIYTNVVVRLGAIVTWPQGGPPSASHDTYDPATNLLTIPSVRLNGVTYTNVVITVGALVTQPTYAGRSPSAPVLVLENPLEPATVGQRYERSVVAGIYPDSRYTYQLDSFAYGTPPPGMTVDLNGVLAGTPTSTGRTDVSGNPVAASYSFRVCAVDTFSRVMTTPCPSTTITVQPARFTLSTSVIGRGSIAASPAGPTYAPGTVVQLSATPETGYTFSGWSGACSGTGACSVSMTADRSVAASFAPAPACSYTYSEWSACSGGQQTRNVLGATPAGCTGTPLTSQSCSTANACYYCRFDVACRVFGAGGCWRCSTSTVVDGSCTGPGDALFFYGSACRADAALYQVCQ